MLPDLKPVMIESLFFFWGGGGGGHLAKKDDYEHTGTFHHCKNAFVSWGLIFFCLVLVLVKNKKIGLG